MRGCLGGWVAGGRVSSGVEQLWLAVGCRAVLGDPRRRTGKPAGRLLGQRSSLTPSPTPFLLPAHPLIAQMDAAASLLLLSILILLSKERNAQLQLGHPLVAAVAACLCLPLLALLPGSFRAW